MKDTNQSIFSQESKLYFDRMSFQSLPILDLGDYPVSARTQSKNADVEKSYSIIPKLVKETGFMMKRRKSSTTYIVHTSLSFLACGEQTHT